jgi:paired amphipathic helix protein Sin3a
LLRRNPAGAIPIILKRLRQKDLEWRKARQQLNAQWKEVVIKNYDKSKDHKSFYFKQQDKHTYSARHLIAEVKTNPADQPVAPSISAGVKIPVKGVSESCSDKAIQKLCSDSKPQIFLTTNTKDHVALMLVYRVICYAVENSSMSALDKEKISAIWRDLLRVVFNMPVHYIYGGPAHVPSTPVPPTDSSDSVSNTQTSVPPAMDAFAIGTRVVTQYGIGTVLSYDEKTSIHKVQLSFGISFLPSAAIIGAETLSPSALEAIGVQSDKDGDVILQSEKDGIKVQDYRDKVNSSASSSRPLVHDPNFVFYGTQMCYILFRLHHTLMVRLSLAMELSEIKQGEFRARRRFDASASGSVADDTGLVDPDDSDVEDLMAEDDDINGKDEKENVEGKGNDSKNGTNKRVISHAFTDDNAEILRKKKKGKFSRMISERKSVLNTYLSQLYGLIDGSIDSAK